MSYLKKSLVLLFFYLYFSFNSLGQEQAPASIKWYQKNSDNFKIIFPYELDSIANYTLGFLENIYPVVSRDLKVKVKKTPIILHNTSSVSNAFVAWGPKRSEFFITTPPLDYTFIGNNNWVNLLSIHELRHLVQTEKALGKPINKLVYFLFGENTFRALSAASTPFWFWEGDAVDIETRLTNYGRGREPSFVRTSKVNINTYGLFNYYKHTLGSYKYKTPNEYESGYIMVKYLKENFGENVFNKILDKTFSQSLIFFPFVRNLKKETGLNLQNLYKKSFKNFVIVDKKNASKNNNLNPRKQTHYSDYLYPTRDKNNNILVLKKGLNNLKHFSTIDQNKIEKKIFTPGLIKDQGFISYANHLLGWIEYHKDPRWQKRIYSNIKIFDLEKKKFIYKTKKSMFSSISLSPDGLLFVALENLPSGIKKLVFKEIASNKNLNTILLKKGDYSYLRFSDEKNKIIGLKTQDEKKEIVLINLDNGKEKILYSTYENIGAPNKIGSFVFFNNVVSGVDNVVCLNLASKKKFLFTNSMYGAYNASIGVGNEDASKIKILYNDYTSYGLDVYEKFFSETNNANIIKNEETKRKVNLDYEKKKYSTKKYSKWKNLIRPVDWGLYSYSGDIKGIEELSFGVGSQDLMGNLVFSGGYKYNFDDKEGSGIFKISYLGLYPIFDISLLKTKKKSVINNDSKNYDVRWDEKELKTGIKLPLLYTNSKYLTTFHLESNYSLTRLENVYAPFFPGTLTLNNDHISYVTNILYYSRLHKKTKRNVYYPWGQSILLQHKNMTKKSDYSGYFIRSDLYLDFPGIKTTHSLRTRLRLEKQTQKGYSFVSSVSSINGYKTKGPFKKLISWGIEYETPVAYPHFHLGSLLNIQRIRYTSFINNGRVFGVDYKDNPISFGGELYFDVNIFRQLSVFNIGLRWSHLLLDNKTSLNLLLSSVSF